MKNSDAIKLLDALYDSTYDDALAYIAGKTGNLNSAEAILIDTYTEVYKAIKSTKNINPDKINNLLVDKLKTATRNHQTTNAEELYIDFSTFDEKSIERILSTEFDLDTNKLENTLLLKKVNGYISKLPTFQQKSFVLHFYIGYSINQISHLLGESEEKITSSIGTTLNSIIINFLEEHISK